ncbi:uncharacterized protein LOC119405180 [Rhipicephalus sanguineus]|uniref:uncharacterized protein LOC119405180 n=1 Tax=Rhipicephalus sanguineus TaxID=34632 RepID=UPI00189361B7|nr:uncharacterized protein LOC119405180 [Rhipicephalus sanguineus]
MEAVCLLWCCAKISTVRARFSRRISRKPRVVQPAGNHTFMSSKWFRVTRIGVLRSGMRWRELEPVNLESKSHVYGKRVELGAQACSTRNPISTRPDKGSRDEAWLPSRGVLFQTLDFKGWIGETGAVRGPALLERTARRRHPDRSGSWQDHSFHGCRHQEVMTLRHLKFNKNQQKSNGHGRRVV